VTFRVLESFRADYRRLPHDAQEKVDKTLLRFEENPRHSALQVKKMQGTRNIYECRVSIGYRLTFHWEGDVVALRRVGTHDILKRETR
jgi:mRNA interferase RelE/StbE